MTMKDVYVEKLKLQLDEWSADIDVLEARLRKADADIRANTEEQLAVLKARHDDAKAKLVELSESAGDAWQELRKGSDEAWEIIKKSLIEAHKKLRN